jgi:hypothetical protein
MQGERSDEIAVVFDRIHAGGWSVGDHCVLFLQTKAAGPPDARY